MTNKEPSKFFSRYDWLALPPRTIQDLRTPVSHVICLWAEAEPCQTTNDCKRTMREIQRHHLAKNLTDIQSNFYIGGDGNIYEGRGWHYLSPERPKDSEFSEEIKKDFIELAFIGRPVSGLLPDELQLKAASDILSLGTHEKYLKRKSRFYFLTNKGLHFLDNFNADFSSARSLTSGPKNVQIPESYKKIQ